MVDALEGAKRVMAVQLRVDERELLPERSFVDDLGADQDDMVLVATALEGILQIEIPDADLTRLRTVGDAIAYLQSRISEDQSKR
jgi:acyl carrier protein